MSTSIRLHCPGCRARIKAPAQLLGKRRDCPGCGTPFVVRRQPPMDSNPVLVASDRRPAK